MSDPRSPRAQPNRDGQSKAERPEETVAATDEFFKQPPPLPLEPAAKEDPSPLRHAEEIALPGKGPSSVGPDYLRELKEEFEEQQEEGKIPGS